MAFFGREEDLQRLGALWKRAQAALVTCRGRRRIGKSTLVRQFADRSGALLLRLEGLAPQGRMTNADQLAAFGRQLAEQTGASPEIPENWFDAFRLLDRAIPAGGRTVVLLDEVSWMGRHDPNFAGELKYAWDNRFHGRQNLIVVVCGSVSAWIDENILSNTGFVGRISLDLIVRELPLRDCARFWGKALARVSPREVLDVLAVTGGVPRYLEELDPSLSADDNIGRMCFSPNGYLFRDFNDVFTSVFGANAPVKRKILEALAETELGGVELAARLGIARNGRLSSVMDELEMAGFVSKNAGMNPSTGKRSRQDRYRLKDNYARFYLKYIAPCREQVLGGTFEFSPSKTYRRGTPCWASSSRTWSSTTSTGFCLSSTWKASRSSRRLLGGAAGPAMPPVARLTCWYNRESRSAWSKSSGRTKSAKRSSVKSPKRYAV